MSFRHSVRFYSWCDFVIVISTCKVAKPSDWMLDWWAGGDSFWRASTAAAVEKMKEQSLHVFRYLSTEFRHFRLSKRGRRESDALTSQPVDGFRNAFEEIDWSWKAVKCNKCCSAALKWMEITGLTIQFVTSGVELPVVYRSCPRRNESINTNK